jgi:hypothetical protein
LPPLPRRLQLQDGLECRLGRRAAALVVVMTEVAVEAAAVRRAIHLRRQLTVPIHR